MWRNTRLVVLTAMSASLYAALLIPFKVLPLIPGVTEFRPANAIPVVCSLLFGPAGAWGAAIGNLIGDFFGGIGPGDLFGFAGNFLYGLIPYHAWRALTDADPVPRTAAAVGGVRRRRRRSPPGRARCASAGASTSSASCRSRCWATSSSSTTSSCPSCWRRCCSAPSIRACKRRRPALRRPGAAAGAIARGCAGSGSRSSWSASIGGFLVAQC